MNQNIRLVLIMVGLWVVAGIHLYFKLDPHPYLAASIIVGAML